MSLKLVAGLRKGRAGAVWCQFLAAVTDAVVAPLRKKRARMCLSNWVPSLVSLSFHPCWDFILSFSLALPHAGFAFLASPTLFLPSSGWREIASAGAQTGRRLGQADTVVTLIKALGRLCVPRPLSGCAREPGEVYLK